MKTRAAVRFARRVRLACVCVALAVGIVPAPRLEAQPQKLVTEFEPGPLDPIRTGANVKPTIFSDEKGNVLIVWRERTGYHDRNEVESIFLVKLNPDGTSAQGGRARVIAQKIEGIPNLQAAGAHAALPDGAGGFFYLWGRHVLRFDSNQKPVWPAGPFHQGSAHELYRAPSSVRITLDEKAQIQGSRVRFFAGAKGTALALWTHAHADGGSNCVYGNVIGGDGKMLWGDRARCLFQDEGARYAGDGRGGAVVVRGHVKAYVPCQLEFHPGGKPGAKSPQKDDYYSDPAYFRMEGDGRGGVVLFYRKAHYSDGVADAHELRVARFDARGKRLFDRAVSEPGKGSEDHQMMYLRVDGDAILTAWHDKPKVDPEVDAPKFHLFIARHSLAGNPAWPTRKGTVPGEVAGGKENEVRNRVMIARGADTYILFESLVPVTYVSTGVETNVFLQKISAAGKPAFEGIGKRVSQNGGYWPTLVHLGAGRIGAIYFDEFGGESGASAVSVPHIYAE